MGEESYRNWLVIVGAFQAVANVLLVFALIVVYLRRDK